MSQLTGKDNLGLQAGDGWTGDSLCRLEGDRGGFTAWVVDLATKEAAGDFDYALTRGLSERAGGTTFEATAPGRKALSTSERVVRVEQDGTEVRVRIASPALDRDLEPRPQTPTPPKKTQKT